MKVKLTDAVTRVVALTYGVETIASMPCMTDDDVMNAIDLIHKYLESLDTVDGYRVSITRYMNVR